MADSTYVGTSAGGHARQHNGDVINNYRYKYSLRARDSDASLRGDDRNRLLLQAAAEGQLPRIQHLLRLGASVDYCDDSALRALHHAVLSGFEDCVQELITQGADINVMTQNGVALNIAARKERSRVAAILLRARADRGKAFAFAADGGQNLDSIQEFFTTAVHAFVATEKLSAPSGVHVTHKAEPIEETSDVGGGPVDEHARDSPIAKHGRQPKAQVTTSQALSEPQLSRSSDNTLQQSFSLQTFFRMLMGRKPHASECEWERGNIGLTTLYKPSHDAVADIIFVHGYGGDSKTTWMRDGDPSTFWPLEWLPKDPDFRDVGIHTFGYDTKLTSPGGSMRVSNANIHDHAQSLLVWFTDCPDIGNRNETPVFFVCYGMGGVVAKQAYILSRQSQSWSRLGSCLCGMMFLATPHRGISRGIVLKLFSQVIHESNEDFRRLAQDRLNSLRLYSFYEGRPSKSGIGESSSFVVEKMNAILELSGERVSLMDADHMNMSKFESRDSQNYRLVRNALASSIDALRSGNATKS